MPTAALTGPLGAALSLPEVVLAVAGLLAVASFLALVTRAAGVPLSLILVLVGFAGGELARASGVDLPLEGEAFEEVLVFVFLPVLVFEAALSLDARVFFRNLVPILALAVGALAVSAVVVGVAVHVGLGVSIATALLFGALISATDPVAVVAVFRELGVPRRLLTIVDGESLLNDGIAIVLFEILLVAAVGTESVGVGEGVLDFLLVFLGGAAIGGAIGLLVAEMAARLGALPSTALTVAAAYGSFVIADDVLGFSGVLASVSAGLVLAALSGTLIPADEVRVWHTVWEWAGFTANGILFLLIGLVLEAELIAEHWPSILLAVAAVLVARPLGILPVMPAVTRVARLPAVGLRNELVLVWGGLRGGVALALALALPEQLAERDRLVAMTGGVVLATLVLNATTIRWLVHRLGLDQPDDSTRFASAVARLSGVYGARDALQRVGLGRDAAGDLDAFERSSLEEIASLELESHQLENCLVSRGLAVERTVYEELIADGLLPQWHGRVLLNVLDEQIDELALGRLTTPTPFEAKRLRWLVYRIAQRIHGFRPTPEASVQLAFSDAMARRTAAQSALDAIDRVQNCLPGRREELRRARRFFERRVGDGLRALAHLAGEFPDLTSEARRHHAVDLARVAASAEVRDLADLGLVPGAAVERVRERITASLGAAPRRARS